MDLDSLVADAQRKQISSKHWHGSGTNIAEMEGQDASRSHV
jgi:hypothetical protein